MTVTDELLARAQAYAASFDDKGDLPIPPARQVAVIACMDARLDPYGLLGLSEGDAHLIRNVGGVVTQDELRSLPTSQRLLGTREIVLVHHTDCGMLIFTDQDFRDSISAETGVPELGVRGVRRPRRRRAAEHGARPRGDVDPARGLGARVRLLGRGRVVARGGVRPVQRSATSRPGSGDPGSLLVGDDQVEPDRQLRALEGLAGVRDG